MALIFDGREIFLNELNDDCDYDDYDNDIEFDDDFADYPLDYFVE